MTIRIRGVPALIFLVAAGAFVLWRNAQAYADLEVGAARELETWIRAEYIRKHLSSVNGPEELTPAKTDSILATRNITFPSVKARGTTDDMVVRAEFLIDGKPPPDGNNVRYYRMEYSQWIGWTMESETHALSYYLTLF